MSDEPVADRATEAQLRDYDAASVIKAARIIRKPEGYVLVVRLTWKERDVMIYNHRQKPRAWASLDRMLAYLSEVAPSIQVIELVLHES